MRKTRSNVYRIFQGAAVLTAANYGDAVSRWLRENYGVFRCGPKLLAEAADVTIRSATNWLSGLCAPQGAPLLRLMANDRAFRAEINRLLDECAEQSARAARTSSAISARNRKIAARVAAMADQDVAGDWQLVPSAGGVAAIGGGCDPIIIVTADYTGPDRRGALR